jgi:hypothetical protein
MVRNIKKPSTYAVRAFGEFTKIHKGVIDFLNQTSRNTFPQRNRVPILLFLCVLCALAVNFPGFAQTQPEPFPISISSQGELGNANSAHLSLSTDGRFVAFASHASNLVPDDTNNLADIFVHDRLTGKTTRVSKSTTGEQADAASENPVISAQGRFVAFQSAAASLVPGGQEPSTINQIYVHDRLTGLTERVSVNDRGQSGDSHSRNPSISSDGRYIAFQSEAGNLVLDDNNEAADVFIRDRLTGHTILASPNSRGSASGQPSGAISELSEDGRTVVFSSEAAGLTLAISDEPRIYLYKRVLARIDYLNLPVDKSQRAIVQVDTSASADIIAALVQLDGAGFEIIVYDTINNKQQIIDTIEASSEPLDVELSANGKMLSVMLAATEIRRYDISTLESQTISLGDSSAETTISSDGKVIGYTQELDGVTQVFILDSENPAALGHTLSGRVTDASGHPLSLVTIKTSSGLAMRTDGSGYFFFSALPPQTASLVPTKEGFTFEPEQIPFEANSDLNGLHFQSSHKTVLEEARKDLGMPYNFDRGGNGPFHGFAAGFCTDLILDAFSWGADYHIQFALEQDYKANPEHVYRWRDARNANDMWRYFAYSGQMLPHAAPYQPGDIVFFDWSEDGEIDHVSIVSEVDHLNRPEAMYDATGVIDSNPSGRAAELPWEAFHEHTERGHARWSGQLEPIVTQLPAGEYLQVLVGSAQVELRVLDPRGNLLSDRQSLIPGGRFLDLGWEQSLSIYAPQANGNTYSAEIRNLSDAPAAYQFLAHTIQDGLVTERIEFKATLVPKASYHITLDVVLDANGKLILSAKTDS